MGASEQHEPGELPLGGGWEAGPVRVGDTVGAAPDTGRLPSMRCSVILRLLVSTQRRRFSGSMSRIGK